MSDVIDILRFLVTGRVTMMNFLTGEMGTVTMPWGVRWRLVMASLRLRIRLWPTTRTTTSTRQLPEYWETEGDWDMAELDGWLYNRDSRWEEG